MLRDFYILESLHLPQLTDLQTLKKHTVIDAVPGIYVISIDRHHFRDTVPLIEH